MTLQTTLIQQGIASQDADVLANAYPDADPAEFIAGLDWVTQLCMFGQTSSGQLPTSEPWLKLATALDQAQPGDFSDVFAQTIVDVSAELQTALSEAVFARADALRQSAQPQPATRKRKHVQSAEYIQKLADLGYAFRMNDLNDMVEVAISGSWQVLSDPLAAKIRRQMRDAGLGEINAMEDAYIAEAYDHRYHPVLDYLNGLQYDGQQHITALASHFTDKDGVFPIYIRRWLIGAVAKVRKQEQNRVLVLAGPQNIGKSFLVKWLGSVLPGYYIEAPITPDDKDTHIRLASKWVWEIGEFGSTTRKADREALKSFLTQSAITVRKAYGRNDMTKPALASFIGTFNDEGGVLNDPTGSRRFMATTMMGINWAYSTSLDPHQVWAEANAAYLAGESGTLTADEAELATQYNERYEIDDPIEGLLKRWFRIELNNPLVYTPTDQILTTLETNGLRGGSTRQHSMALAAVMTKLGCERVRRTNLHGQRVWCYQGVTPI